MDTHHQISGSPTCHCFWSVYWQGRPQRSLCRMHRQRHLEDVREIQAECIKDKRNLKRICRCRCRSCLRQSDRWGHLLSRRNVELFPPQNNVEELLLCSCGYSSSRSNEPIPDRT